MEFEAAAEAEGGDVRPLSDMLGGELSPAALPLRSGHYAGRKKGWGQLAPGAMVAYQTIATGFQRRELTVGRVLVNNRAEKTIVVQPCSAEWGGVRVTHRLLYQTPAGYSTTPAPLQAKTIR